jgi:hypothetical protein
LIYFSKNKIDLEYYPPEDPNNTKSNNQAPEPIPNEVQIFRFLIL